MIKTIITRMHFFLLAWLSSSIEENNENLGSNWRKLLKIMADM
jgi:hypothetical protein